MCSNNDVKEKLYIKIDRPVYKTSDIESNAPDYEIVKKSSWPFYRCTLRDVMFSIVPSIYWISHYQWKHDFSRDVIAGCTVAIMNIPQGMAYSMLANIPPVVGIYMAFYPALIYTFLGTSRHVSMGSFAVVCLMVGKVIAQYATSSDTVVNGIMSYNSTVADTDHATLIPTQNISPTEVATIVAFVVGLFQVIMYLCRLGIICALLSETLISGFTAGAAVHVFTSQIKDLFGLKLNKYNGAFSIVYTYMDLFDKMNTLNVVATIVSTITILILAINLSVIKPWVSKRSIIPVPIELIAILIGTVVSSEFQMEKRYHLKVVGHIETGLPGFSPPPFSLIPNVAADSAVIAAVAYIISVSMAMIFAQKSKYVVNPNQELLAQGAANLFGSFFSCAPISASLSRSMIQYTVGGKTQFASLVSCSILLVVMLWFASFFEPLPSCVLSSLIVVALKSVLSQVKDLPKIWKLSILDGFVWIVTFASVVLLEIDIGLLVGVVASIASLFLQAIRPYICQLGCIPNTEIYVDKSRYTQAMDPPGVKVIHYSGSLNFANRSYFKKDLYQILNIWSTIKISRNRSNQVYDIKSADKVHFLVLNMSGIQYIDSSGATFLKQLSEELLDMGISVYTASMTERVYESFRVNGLLESNLFTYFPTIHDAVSYARSKLPYLQIA